MVYGLIKKKLLILLTIGILLQKIHHFGIKGITNDWFHSYPTGRIHSTQIGSEPLTTACSATQGSLLGP